MTITKHKKSDEEVIREIAEFKGDYLPVDKDRLALFAVDFLESKNIEPTFDKIVVTAFKLFPKKFSLVGFPEYLDSLTVHYCIYIHGTKAKGWLSGNVQTGYKVTDKGKYFLDETKKILEGKIKITKTRGIVPRRKEVTFIEALKKTEAYKKYMHGQKEEVTQYEIFESIKVSQESSELIESHLKKFLEYANRINDSSVIEFLEFIREKLGGNKDAYRTKDRTRRSAS